MKLCADYRARHARCAYSCATEPTEQSTSAVLEHRTDACAAINHGVPCRTSGTAGMLPGLLRQQQDASRNKGCDDGRRDRPTQGQPAFVDRLIEKIAERGAERPRQDEGRPEQENAGHIGQEIERNQRR